jgi:putative zinc finger protein
MMPAMCDERERLIGYVYDECEPPERRAIESHLDECADCRAEIGALRRVRQDLLAWDVPAHEPVWRPFAPAPIVPWYRQVPAWAMAAAAGVMFLIGAAGGVVTHAMLPQERAVVATAPASTPTLVPIGVTPTQLSEAEQRMVQMMRAELNKRDVPRTTSNAQLMPASIGATLTQDQFNNLLRASEQRQWEMVAGVSNEYMKQINSLRREMSGIKEAVALAQQGGGR